MKGIHYWIEKRAYTNPDRVAIITEGEEISYRTLHKVIKHTTAYLHAEKKVKRGDRIAILSSNSAEYIVLLFAIASLECVAVPLNTRLNAKELHYQLVDSGAKMIFMENNFTSIGHEIKESMHMELIQINKIKNLNNVSEYNMAVDEHAPYIICYTSGTTGKPKGAVLTQHNMFVNAINNATTIDITSRDRTIVLLPLFHIGGIGLFAFPTLFMGGTIVISEKFDPDKALHLIETHSVTIVMGVPAIHQALLGNDQFNQTDLSSVRWFYSGGAPCPPKLIKEYFDKGFLFGQGFGLTETSPTIFLLSQEDAKRKIGSVGKPVLFCEYKLIDDEGNNVNVGEIGNLVVSGGNVMKEYWNNPVATNKDLIDGWFHTGDLAKVDQEGFVYIAGRKKEMIISGGENIYPLEVESVINKLEEVSEVAVIGIPDEKWGEIPIAFVATTPTKQLSEACIVSHCKEYIGGYKIPKKIIFLDMLPKNSTGKINKKKLSLDWEE